MKDNLPKYRDVMKGLSGTMPERRAAAKTFADIAEINGEYFEYEYRLNTLVKLLSDPDSQVRGHAIRSIVSLTESDFEDFNEEMIMHRDHNARRFDYCWDHFIVVLDGVQPLLRLLNDTNSSIRKNAALVFRNLAEREIGRPNKHRAPIGDWFITRDGVTETLTEMLTKLLDDTDLCVKQHALETLDGLPGAAANIIKTGGIQPLLELLDHPSEKIQECSAATLSTLARHAETAECIAKEGGIDSLVKLLNHTNIGVREYAYHALVELDSNIKNIEYKGHISKAEAKFLTMYPSPPSHFTYGQRCRTGRPVPWRSIKTAIKRLSGKRATKLRALESLSTWCEARVYQKEPHPNLKRIAELEGIKALTEVLRDNDQEAQRSAMEILAAVVSNKENRHLIAQTEAIPLVVKILRNSNYVSTGCDGEYFVGDSHQTQRYHAAEVLELLTEEDQFKNQIVKAGGVEALLLFIEDSIQNLHLLFSNDGMLYDDSGLSDPMGIRAILNLLANPKIREQIVNLSDVEQLLSAGNFSHDASVLAKEALMELTKHTRSKINTTKVKEKRADVHANSASAGGGAGGGGGRKIDVTPERFNPLPSIECYSDEDFCDTGRHRLGGSSFCSGVFKQQSDDALWVGKCNILSDEQAAKADACKEKIASDIYNYYSVKVPETALARLPIILPKWAKTVSDLDIGADRTHTVYLLSKIIPAFNVFPDMLTLKKQTPLQFNIPGRGLLPVIGLGRILAVAAFISDVDVIGGGGGNIGYQVVGDEARCVKVDPGEAFNTYEQLKVAPKEVRVATQADNGVLAYDDFPTSVKQEFLETLASIVETDDETVVRFFMREGAESLLLHKNAETLKEMPQLMMKRRDELKVTYEVELLGVQAKPRKKLAPLKTNKIQEHDIVATLQTIDHRKKSAATLTQPPPDAIPTKDPSRIGIISAERIQYDQKRDLLDSGSFANVYKGKWRGTDVAVKTLKIETMTASEIEDLRREGEIMMKLFHPNIMRVYGVCLEKGNYSLIMQYYPQGTLYTLLRAEGDLAWPKRLTIAVGIGYGLSYLHDHDVLHRDLKSLNILMHHDTPVLADFGSAKIKTAETMTKTLVQGVGSLPWMPPEMLDPEGKYKQACDIYSLGMIYYELTTRNTPWSKVQFAFSIAIAVMKEKRPEIPRDTPAKFSHLIRWCWSQEAKDRPRPEEVIAELEAQMAP